VAYAVSKRAGSAVARNRLRRRLRAAVAHHRGRMRPGTAYLFGAGSEAATANWTDVEVAVGDLIEWAARPGVGKGPHAPEEPGVGAPGGQAKPQRHSP
jgi:ribonuclease P protein component